MPIAAKIIIPVSTPGADATTASMTKLDTSLKKTKKSVDETDNEIRILRDAFGKLLPSTAKAASSFGRVAGAFKKYRAASRAAKEETKRLMKAEGALSTSLNKLFPPAKKSGTAIRRLTKALRAYKKEAGEAKKSTGGLKSSLAGMGKFLGIAAVAAFTKKIVTLGSDAEETANKFNVVFKDVPERAGEAAANLAANFAIAKDESQKLLSNTGDLLTGFGFTGDAALTMSEDVNTLAADLASFTNIEGGTERASKALTSALFGNTESAKELGIAIRDEDIMARLAAQGMSKLKGQALLQAKAQAALAIATEQSKNAIGDFARSSDSFANVSKRLLANIRDLAVQAGQEALPKFKELATTFVLATEKGGFLSKVAITLGKVLGTLADVVAQTVGIFDILTKSSALEDTREEIEAANFQGNQMVAVGKAILKTYGRGSKEFQSYVKAMKKMREAAPDLSSKLEDQVNSLSKTGDALKKARDRLLGYDEELKKTSESQKKSTDLTNKGTAATVKGAEATEDFAKAQKEALAIIAGAGGADALSAQLELLKMQQAEQTKIVEAAGESAASLDQFYQKKRETQLQNFLQQSISDESMGFSDRQAMLQSNYETLLETENLSYEDRLAAQQAYTEASNNLEQQRMQTIAQGVNDFATFGNEIVGIGKAYSNLRQAQIKQEIEDLRARGASEEEIAKKEKELQRKAAEDNKKIQLASAFINVAQGVTRALAAFPPPASYVLAALTATKGALEIAAIQATPIPGAQFGGQFTVPPGNEADSGLLRVNQGENVTVEPVRESGRGGDKEFGTIMIGGQPFEAFLTTSMQRIFDEGKVQIRRKGTVKVA
jgi:hypothetical protein